MVKIFDNIFKKLESDIDVYVVEWITYKEGCAIKFPEVKKCYQAFTNKNEAENFRDCINNSLKICGIESLPKAQMYKQDKNTL